MTEKTQKTGTKNNEETEQDRTVGKGREDDRVRNGRGEGERYTTSSKTS